MDRLTVLIEKFSESGWELLESPCRKWLQNGDAERANLIAALEQADRECGSCGCEFDPLYKEALFLLKNES